MQRFSEHQARIGALVGNGLNFITDKTALTRSQWLMLSLFVVGAVVIGYASTRGPRAQPAEPKSVDASVGAKSVPAALSASQSTGSASQGTGSASQSTGMADTGPAPVAINAAGEGGTSGVGRNVAQVSSAAPVSNAAASNVAPVSSVESATLARIESLARDIARINQKLDDVATKQRQTATRLTALIADTKQVRPSRDTGDIGAEKSDSAGHRSGAPVVRKKTQTAAPLLTVHKKPVVARRPNADLRRAALRAIIVHRAEMAEHSRRLHRRNLAVAATIFGSPLHLDRIFR